MQCVNYSEFGYINSEKYQFKASICNITQIKYIYFIFEAILYFKTPCKCFSIIKAYLLPKIHYLTDASANT